VYCTGYDPWWLLPVVLTSSTVLVMLAQVVSDASATKLREFLVAR
jgi:outer membrane receptor for monomeric catechols